MKNYFLILLSVLGIGILIGNINSNVDTAHTAISPEITTVEEIPTLSKIEKIQAEEITAINTTAKTPTPTRVVTSTPSSSTPSIPSYRVTIYSNTIVSRNLTYRDIYKTKKLIYGHNSANLLGNVKNLGVGSTFTVIENDTSTTYRVANVGIFKKTDDYTLSLCLSGYNNCTGGNYYLNTLQKAILNGQNYDIALFTCDGTSLGGGDATHRRIVFAYKI